MNRTPFALSFLPVCLLMACQPSPHSTVDIANGIVVPEAKHPSVALLVMNGNGGEFYCTATFITSSVALTAAHCVEGLKDPNASPMSYIRRNADGKQYVAAQVESFVQFPGYDIKSGYGANDLAIVRFPEGTAPALSDIGPTPIVGETITVAGYGNNNFTFHPSGAVLSATGALTLRSGQNVINSESEGMLYFAGITKAKIEGLKLGTEVSAGQGDSGGPMFVNGKLVGVASGVGFAGEDPNGGQVALSAYVDINSESSQAFLKNALASDESTDK